MMKTLSWDHMIQKNLIGTYKVNVKIKMDPVGHSLDNSNIYHGLHISRAYFSDHSTLT